MDEFTTDELRLILRALRAFSRGKESKYDFDLAEQAEELADRFGLAVEDRKSRRDR